MVNTSKQNMPFFFQNNCTKRKSLHLLRHSCPRLNQMFIQYVALLPFQSVTKGYIYKEAFPGLVYCQHFFSFSFLTVSKEVVFIVPMMASRDVIFPNCWFCSAEWSRLSIAIPDNFALNIQTHKAIRRLSEEIPPAAGFPVRAEPDLRTCSNKCLPDLSFRTHCLLLSCLIQETSDALSHHRCKESCWLLPYWS